MRILAAIHSPEALVPPIGRIVQHLALLRFFPTVPRFCTLRM